MASGDRERNRRNLRCRDAFRYATTRDHRLKHTPDVTGEAPAIAPLREADLRRLSHEVSVNDDLRVRDIRDEDWSAILAIANQSVADVAGAGRQDEWLANRRNFDASRGTREHYVVEHAGEVVGYGGIESVSALPEGEFRMFIVVASRRLADVGERLYQTALAALARNRARRVHLTEYAKDQSLRDFLERRGFTETRRFRIPDGNEVVTLSRPV